MAGVISASRLSGAVSGAAGLLEAEAWLELGTMLDEPACAVEAAASLLRVRNKQGRVVPLVANRAQQNFEERRGRENVVLKARQMGVSTWIAGRFLLKTLLVPGTVTVQVAHTREAAEGLFRIVQRMWENLPAELQEGIGRRRTANVSAMRFAETDSEFLVVSAAEPNAGRGLTVTNLHCSEVSRWPGNAAETLAGLRAALAPGGEIVLESTPNGAYGCFYQEWTTAVERGAVRHFFPWWWEPSYAGFAAPNLSGEEAVLVAAHGLSTEQIGFRRELAARFGPMRAQEFAEDAVSCFRQSGAGVFDGDALAARLCAVDPPMETRWGGSLQVWRPAVRGREYVLAADPAGGGAEGDFAAVEVVDVGSGMQCAEMQARISPRLLAERIAELAAEFNGALVVVERNNHGAAVLAYLERSPALRMYEGADGSAGWLTSASSRERVLARLGVLLSTRRELFASARLLEECRSFVLKPGGRIEAAAGAHDDLVMAMAIAQEVREGCR